MTLTMADSAFNLQFPHGMDAYAAYVDGKIGDQPNFTWIVEHFPDAEHLSISVLGNDADCLDIESGAASVAVASGWYAKQKALGAGRPCFYASAGLMESDLIPAINAARIPRDAVRLWSAHYTNTAHICGPATCKALSIPADGTQWTDHDGSLTADQSLLADDFFGKEMKTMTITYSPVTAQLPELTPGVKDANLPHWYVRRVQALLNYVYGYPCHITGTYDVMTVNAVRMLQARYKLSVDGICGPQTWAKIIGG